MERENKQKKYGILITKRLALFPLLVDSLYSIVTNLNFTSLLHRPSAKPISLSCFFLLHDAL